MTTDLAHQALCEAYPAIKSFLSARIQDIDARDRVEHLVAGHHYIVGDANGGYYYPVQHYVGVLAAIEGEHNVPVDHLLTSHQTAFDQVIESALYELMTGGGMHQHLLHDIFKSDAATQLFIACAKSFLLACTLKLFPGQLFPGQRDAAELSAPLRPLFFAEMASLEFLKRFHLDWMRQARDSAKQCIAFYCPDGAHRARWARLPELLQRDGYAVLLLYATANGDAFEMAPNAFYVGQGLLMQIDCVDLFVTESAIDGLPDCSKKALFVADGYVLTSQPSNAVEGSLLNQYRHALNLQGGLSAYFRVYDYLIATSAQTRATLLRIAQAYGLTTEAQATLPHEPRCALPIDLFNGALQGRALPKQICIIVASTDEVALCELVAKMLRAEGCEAWDCLENGMTDIEFLPQ